MNYIKKFLYFITHPENSVFSPSLLPQAITIAILNVRFFYFVLLFLAFDRLVKWQTYQYPTLVDPLWPVSWTSLTNIPYAYFFILTLFIVGAFSAAIFPSKRFFRIFAFIGFFEYTAYIYSVGKIDHSLHIWIISALLFIFLPSYSHKDNKSSFESQKYLLVFWFAQVFTLLTYSMAGMWKIVSIIDQTFKGEGFILLTQSMALHIANRLQSTNEISLLGPWIIDNPWVGWFLFPGGIYLEVFSLYIAFKPNLHKIWGAFLIILHISIYLTMAISFRDTILLLAILFLNTPFERPDTTWKERLSELPLFGFMFRSIIK